MDRGAHLVIRTAQLSDAQALAAIEAACFPPAEAATAGQIAERLRVYADHFWLLDQNGQVIAFVDGFVTDEPDLTDEMYAHAEWHQADGAWQMIFGVNTLPEYRQRGYASQLLRQAISAARAEGRLGLVLTCKPALIPFYTQFGFVDEGISASTHGSTLWHQMRLRFL